MASIHHEYIVRSTTLSSIGFKSYREYLSSPLWYSIKLKVFTLKGHSCAAKCGKEAACIHHRKYHKEVLLGKDLGPLVPLCHGCHEKIEITPTGAKRSLKAANKLLTKITEENSKKPKTKMKKRVGGKPWIGLLHKAKHLARRRLR